MDEEKDIRLRTKLEINNTMILAIAALAITWCTYQGTLWEGVQSFKLAEANQQLQSAHEKALLVAQQQSVDVSLALEFLNAVVENKQENIDYYLHRGRNELVDIMAAWLALDPMKNRNAPPHPLAMPQYNKMVSNMLAGSDSASKRASALWREAQHANSISDKYVLLTVVFSMVMFLGAIATKISHLRITFTLIAASGIVCILILLLLFFTMPVTGGG